MDRDDLLHRPAAKRPWIVSFDLKMYIQQDKNTWDQKLKPSVRTACMLKCNKRSGKSLLVGLAEP